MFSYRNKFDELNEFVYEALKIFEIYGYIELIPHLNTTLEVNLVTCLKETDLKSKIEESFYVNFKKECKKNRRQNIADLGKGTANLMGLILKIFSVIKKYEKIGIIKKAEKKRINDNPKKQKQKLILVEEPESFLHPNWQSKLADFFVYCMNYGKIANVRFLIETHSVYFIQRLQFLVANNDLDKDKIDVVFFNPENHKEKFYNMGLRDDGRFVNKFGSGFYDETASLTIDILNAQSQ